MPKRERATDTKEHDDRYHATKKLRQDKPEAAQEISTIHSDRDLQNLLAFRQDAKELKAAIKKFREFLHTIIYPADGQTSNRQNLGFLGSYLARNKSTDVDDEQPTYIKDLIEIWAFSSAKNDDSLFSASVAVIALLLKTISSELDLREHGLGICRTLLEHNVSKLLLKGASAAKHKEHVISPCFRLLTEIISFDGGAMGRQLYNKRDQLFDPRIIARNLSIVGRTGADEVEAARRPSVRSNVLRYVLANLKFQVEGIKIDIIKQSNVMSALLSGLIDDTAPSIAEALSVMKTNIIQDRNIPWLSKAHIVGEKGLRSFAALYRVKRPDEVVSGTDKTILKVVHDFMLFICTSTLGSLRRSSGFYPKIGRVSEDHDHQGQNDATHSMQAGDDAFGQEYNIRNLSVRNQALAQFAQTLRPYANELEKELLLAILEAAPELVADYWLKKENFTYEPKLTATWIGYSSFIFSAIQIPVPAYFGVTGGYSLHPPPSAIVLESILPLPLNSKTLQKCFFAQSSLINLFATRLLILAIEKLKTILETYRAIDSDRTNRSWAQESDHLLSLFVRRCPDMKDLVDLFRKTPESNMVQREAITRLLSLYYEILPQLALVEKFDISVALTIALEQSENTTSSSTDDNLSVLILAHLVRIASHSTEVSWWKRPDKLKYSAFLTTLLVQVRSEADVDDSLERLLISIVDANGLFQMATKAPALRALVFSIRKLSANERSEGLLAFIDDCLSRYIGRQIAYEDQLDAFLASHGMSVPEMEPISNWTLTLIEQWPYAEKKRSEDVERIASWLFHYVQQLSLCGEDKIFLKAVITAMNKATSNETAKATLSVTRLQSSVENASVSAEAGSTQEPLVPQPSSLAGDKSTDLSAFRPPQHPTIRNFSKFRTMDVDTVLSSTSLTDLIMSLSSSEVSIRTQASSELQHLMIRLQSSSDPDKDMVYVLLGELVETAQQHYREDMNPLPYLITSFATEAMTVVRDPVHVMYVKVAAFLTTRPRWSPLKLVREFLNLVVLAEPSEETDQAPWRECVWLLTWLERGVRTQADCDVLRQVGAWETVGCLIAHPAFAFTSTVTREAISSTVPARSQTVICNLIVKLLGRAVVLGEASTLATRVGGLAWLDAWERSHRIDKDLSTNLRRTILSNGHDRISKWSSGMLVCPDQPQVNGTFQ